MNFVAYKFREIEKKIFLMGMEGGFLGTPNEIFVPTKLNFGILKKNLFEGFGRGGGEF